MSKEDLVKLLSGFFGRDLPKPTQDLDRALRTAKDIRFTLRTDCPERKS